jgi:DNA-binding MarR family transcriptional regulator
MSIAAINWALNEVVDIRSTEKAILIALADRADENGECFPSYDDICRRSCATRNSVSYAIKRFEELGLIERRKRFGKSTVYALNITSSTKNHTTDTRSSTESRTTEEIDFEPFWKAYPRKVNKKTAQIAWRNLSKTDKKRARDGLKDFPFSKEERFIPHASTWIRQRRWEDEIEEEVTLGVYEL